MSDFKLIESSEYKPLIREMRHTHTFTFDEFAEHGIIHPGMEQQEIFNSYRQLRTTLRTRMEKFNSCLLVSSITAGGGASFTAINLASAFTFDHNRTALLIDCNFTRPVLAEKLGVEVKSSLQDYLTDKVDDISKIVYPTGVSRLRLVPSIKHQTEFVEFFSGDKLDIFLEEVRSRYPDRIIIIDTPPILESADTKILSEYIDYILLVIPYKGVTSSAVNKTLASVDKSKVIGMVLNN